MANIFFLSPEMNFCIRHLKATAKFDNSNKGKLRLAIRFIIETTKKIDDELRFFILIVDEKKKITVEKIEKEYNSYFYSQSFRSAAGAANQFFTFKEEEDYVQFLVTKLFVENTKLIGAKVFYPKSVKCRTVKAIDVLRNVEESLSDSDIVIEIVPEISSIRDSTLLIFQVAFILTGFVSEDTISKWRSSGKEWFMNFSFHERIGYQNLFENLADRFSYPEVFEFWVYIPRNHYLIATSPHYETRYVVQATDVPYKIAEKEFDTAKGDAAIKLLNKSGDPLEFSIKCTSPYRDKSFLGFVELYLIPGRYQYSESVSLGLVSSILSSILTLISVVLLLYVVTLISSVFLPRFPISSVIFLSVLFVILITIFVVMELYRFRTRKRQFVKEELRKKEETFFKDIEEDIAQLLTSEV